MIKHTVTMAGISGGGDDVYHGITLPIVWDRPMSLNVQRFRAHHPFGSNQGVIYIKNGIPMYPEKYLNGTALGLDQATARCIELCHQEFYGGLPNEFDQIDPGLVASDINKYPDPREQKVLDEREKNRQEKARIKRLNSTDEDDGGDMDEKEDQPDDSDSDTEPEPLTAAEGKLIDEIKRVEMAKAVLRTRTPAHVFKEWAIEDNLLIWSVTKEPFETAQARQRWQMAWALKLAMLNGEAENKRRPMEIGNGHPIPYTTFPFTFERYLEVRKTKEFLRQLDEEHGNIRFMLSSPFDEQRAEGQTSLTKQIKTKQLINTYIRSKLKEHRDANRIAGKPKPTKDKKKKAKSACVVC